MGEIILKLNETDDAKVHDEDQLAFATGIADRLRRDESVMAYVRNHSDEQVMHGLLPKRVSDAMGDYKKLPMSALENEKAGRVFIYTILRLLSRPSPAASR